MMGCKQPASKNKPTDTGISKKQDSSIGQKNFRTIDEIEEGRKKLLDTNYYYLNRLLESVLISADQKKGLLSISGKIEPKN